MDIPETDSEDEIPPGWEERCTSDGYVFYAFHETKTTQWTHPRTGKRKRVTGDLPYGWERQVDSGGNVHFFDCINKKTTYTDPRLAFATEITENVLELRQRFDGSSTGLQVTHGRDLSGQIAVITGANCGIGFETARSLAFRGCCVIFACRNILEAEKSIDLLKNERPYCNCHSFQLDLSSLKSVKKFVLNFKSKFGRCDVLILNAGIFGLPYTLTEDSLEATLQVNYLSHFYMTLLIQPLMLSSPQARVVFVSSESHRFGSISGKVNLKAILCPTKSEYWSMVAYNNSKLCMVLACFELHRRFADRGLKCFAVHPGNLVSSSLSRNWWIYRLLFTIARPFTKSLQQASACSVFCAVSPDLANCGGAYVNNCVPCRPSPEALDVVLANRLWVFSVDLIEERMGRTAFAL